MSSLFSLVFIGSLISTWVFVRRKPDKRKRNISLGLALISFGAIGLFGGDASAKNVNNSNSAITSTAKTSTSSSETKKLTLDIPKEAEAGKDKTVKITGTTLPGATVAISSETSDKSVKADKKGNFTLLYELSGEESKELEVNSTLKGKTTSSMIVINQNPEVVKQIQAEAKAAQEKAAAEKAKADEEARAAAEKKEQERVAAEQAAAAKKAAEEQAAQQAAADKAAADQQAAAVAAQQQAAAQQETQYVDATGQGTIKGSVNGIYHVPGSTYYNRTKNVVQWFKTISEAENAGYRAPQK